MRKCPPHQIEQVEDKKAEKGTQAEALCSPGVSGNRQERWMALKVKLGCV
jgi:hypothetical protein